MRTSTDDEPLKRYKVVVKDEFWSAFDEILAYISANWWEISVENFSATMWRKISGLDTFPNGHSQWREMPFRYFLVWDYLVFFQVDEVNGVVMVVKIYHAAQNLEKLLNNKEEI